MVLDQWLAFNLEHDKRHLVDHFHTVENGLVSLKSYRIRVVLEHIFSAVARLDLLKRLHD